MGSHAYHLPYGNKRKPKPDADAVKALAAAGLTRKAMAEKLGIDYRRLSYLLGSYYSLSEAEKEGKKLYKEQVKNNASS